jgi:hypothetical protein
MFTENEVAALITFPDINELVDQQRKSFIKAEAPYLEIDNHDFLSLILVTPSLGIALANESVSFFEEMALNKKARKLSKGGYILKKDPVVVAMGFLIKSYDKWAGPFFGVIKSILDKLYNKQDLMTLTKDAAYITDEEFCYLGLKAPFGFIRAITSFFMNEEDEDFIRHRKTNKKDYDRIVLIGEQLGFSEIPFFKKFLTTFDVK